MRISLSQLMGRIPRRSDRGLPPSNATVAIGCDVRSGEIRPFRQSALVQAVSGNTDSIHRWDSGAQQHWLEFPGNVDAINGPVADDVWQRLYWTGDANHDEPRMSYTGPLQSGDGPYPDVSYKLGIPAPETPISATLSAPQSVEIDQIIMERPMRVITKEPHPFQDDELVAFEINSESEDDNTSLSEYLNANEQQVSVISDTEFRILFTDGVAVDYTAFTDGEVSQFAGADAQDVRVYVHTYVSEIGEEGPPSEASQEIRATPWQEVVLQLPSIDFEAGQGRNLTKRRIYRASTGTQSGQFQFLAEVELSQSEFNDTEQNLLETLPSVAWDPPPEKLKGLRLAAQGFAVGFFDNVVAVSEPYRVHAWPTDYQFAVDYEVVAVEIIDNGIVVATTGRPYIIQGVDPRSMLPRRIELSHACVSARSMVSLGYAAVYASIEGLVYVDSGRAELMTRSVLTEREWKAYKPQTIHAHELNGRYIGFYGDASDGAGFLVDPREMDLGWFDLDIWAKDAFRASSDAHLYLLVDGEIRRWDDPDSDPTPFRWRSKVFAMSRPAAFSCYRVSGSGTMTFRLYADGELLHEESVTPERYQRLPLKRASEYQIEIEGTGHLQEVHVADSVEELRA